MQLNLASLFINYGSSLLNDMPSPTYITIVNNKDGSTSAKCLNPPRRRSSCTSLSQPRKKRSFSQSLLSPFFAHSSQPVSKRSNRKSSLKKSPTSPGGRLCSLPIEILHDIVFYLDTPSFVVLASTNQLLMTLFYDDHVWLCRFQHDFHTLTTQDWKQRHMALYRNHSILSSRWMAGQVTTHYLPDGHQDSVYCMTRFGQHHMISGSRDRCLKLWHLPTSKLIMTKRTPHDGSVLCLAVSPDSSTLITGSSDATCILWSLPSMRRIGTLKGHRHGVLDVCYLPDGQTVVSSSRDHTLIIWHQGKELYRLLGHVGPVNSVKVYDADHVVSASGDCTLKIWNVRTGRCVKSLNELPTTGHELDRPATTATTSTVSSAPASTTSTMNSLLSPVSPSATPPLEQRQQPINHGGFACVQVDRERGLIYTGGHNGKLGIWHVDTGKCEASLPGHHALIRSMHRFGSWLVTGSYDRTIKVWDMKKKQCILSFQSGHSSWILNILVTRSRILSAGQDKQIMMLDFGHALQPLDE